jgi:hypothetical protein
MENAKLALNNTCYAIDRAGLRKIISLNRNVSSGRILFQGASSKPEK